MKLTKERAQKLREIIAKIPGNFIDYTSAGEVCACISACEIKEARR